VTLSHFISTSSTGLLIKTFTHVQITLKMAEHTIVCIGCGINLTKKPKKIRRNLGADYKGHWNDESHEHIIVTSDNYLNHIKLYFFYIVVTYSFDSVDNDTL